MNETTRERCIVNHLFAYGTLMCGDIMQVAAGCVPSSASAILCGYSRRRVKDAAYPAIISEATGIVEGRLYCNLPVSAWECLDRFEGDQYERVAVTVTTDHDKLIDAQTYAWKSAGLHYLDKCDWNFEAFLRSGKNDFMEQYPGFTGSIKKT